MSGAPVFLPGWCLGRGPWRATADAVGGTILDLPGYGDLPLAGNFDAAVDAIAARLKPATPLCGWSLGALLALAIAERHPGKVSRLALVSATASFLQRPGWSHAVSPATLAEFAAALAADVASTLPRFIGNFNRGDARARAVTRELLDLADPLPDLATLAAGLAWLRDADLRAAAPRLAVPTLLLHGAEDPLMPLPAAEALAALIPGARLAVLAHCAHAPFISVPAAFEANLADFLHASAD